PPGDNVLVTDVSFELGRELGEGQLFLVNQLGIPDGMKVRRLSEPGDLHVIATLVAALACMKRLMEVADKVNDEAQSELLVGKVRLRILKHRAKMIERFDRVTLRRRVVVNAPVERHIMPWSRSLFPEQAGRRAHLIGPVRSFVQAFRATENFTYMRPRKTA